MRDFYMGGGESNRDNTSLTVLECGEDCTEHLNISGEDLGSEPELMGHLKHSLYDLSRNSSYCIFYQVESLINMTYFLL